MIKILAITLGVSQSFSEMHSLVTLLPVKKRDNDDLPIFSMSIT